MWARKTSQNETAKKTKKAIATMLKYLLMTLATTWLAGAAASAQTLVSQGKPGCVIVLGADAIPAEKTAATELQDFARRMSGAEIPIVAAAGPSNERGRVFIGQTAQTKALLPGFKWETLAHDGILIKRVGADLVLAGDRPRGTLYAVYEYLERLGVRFLAPDETLIPAQATLPLPQTETCYVPKLQYRETTYQRVINGQNAEFAARLRLNGNYNQIPVAFGGNYTVIGDCHTFDLWLPAATYFAAHPEWYSLKKGKRIGGQIIGQLCLTNPEMKQEFIRQTLKQIGLNPAAGMISVSQNDGSGPCECAVCKAEAKKLGNETDLLLQFVNAVAAEVEKAYPAFLVNTLAYSYTRPPPKTIRPRHNVLIQLCTMVDYSQPLDSKLNQTVMNNLVAWSRMTDALFIWDYTVGFGNLHLPFPNTPVLKPNIQTFIAHKTIGLHEQGDLYNPEVSLVPLKTYLLAKLMWDPSQNQDQLTREFLNGYYGAAGKSLYAYLKLIEDARARAGAKLTSFAETAPYLTADVLVKAFALFDQAEKAVADKTTLLKRVKLQRLAIEQAWVRLPLTPRGDVTKRAGLNERRLVDDYVMLATETGNIFPSEGVRFSWDEFRFAALGETKPNTNPVPERVKNRPATDWKEIALGRVRLAAPGVGTMVDDPQAMTGKAIRMAGSSLEWAAQFFLSEYDVKDFSRAEVIFRIKCVGRAAQGHAFDLGVYDNTGAKRSDPTGPSYYLKDIRDDGYHEYSAGVHNLGDGMFIFAAPPGNAKLLEAFFIDRVYLVKAESTSEDTKGPH